MLVSESQDREGQSRILAEIIQSKILRLVGIIILAAVLILPDQSMLPDTSNYMIQALHISDGRGYTDMYGGQITHRPLFPLLLAGTFSLLGATVETAAGLSMLLAILTVVVLFLLGEKLAGNWGGVIAVCLLLSWPFFKAILPMVQTDTIYLLFKVLAIYCLVRSFESGRARGFVLAAICFALAFFAREVALIFVPLPLILLALVPSYRNKRVLVNLLVFYAVFLSLIFLQWVYGYTVTGTVYGLEAGGLADMAEGTVLVGSSAEAVSESPVLLEGIAKVLVGAIGAYLELVPQYIVKYMIPNIDHFFLLFVGWAVCLVLASKGDNDARALWAIFLSWLPLLFIAARVKGEWQHPRYHLVWLAASYIAFAKAFLFAIGGVRRASVLVKRPAMYTAAITVFVLALAGWMMWQAPIRENTGRGGLIDANREIVSSVVDWIGRNVSPQTTLAASEAWAGGTYFQSHGDYNIKRLPVTVSSPLAEDNQLGPMLYLTRYPPQPHLYFVLTEDDALALLKDPQVEYFVYGGDLDYSPLRFLRNVALLDGMTKVFQADDGQYQLHVYKTDAHRVRFRGPAITLTDVPTLAQLLFGPSDIDLLLTEDCTSLPEAEWVLDLLSDRFDLGTPNFHVLWMYNCIGNMSAMAGHSERAAFAFRQIPAYQYRYLPPTDEPFAKHVIAGAKLVSQEQWQSATEEFRKAILIEPNSVSANVGLGHALERSGLTSQAEAAYRQAVILEPGNERLHLALANILRQGAKQDDAMDECQSALEIDPHSPEAAACLLASKGEIAQSQDNLAKALYQFKLAASVASMSPSRVRHLPFYSTSHSLTDPSRYTLSDRLQSELLWRPEAQPEELVHDLIELQGDEQEPDMVRSGIIALDDDARATLFQHPPSKTRFMVEIPANAELRTGLAMSPEVWQLGKGDGVQFDITIESEGVTFSLLSDYIDPKNIAADRIWHDRAIDLSYWAGQAVTLTFSTHPGPNQNSDYDWAGWGAPRIVQPAYFGFLPQFGQAKSEDGPSHVYPTWLVIENDLRSILFQHPVSQVSFDSVDILHDTTLYFGTGIDPTAWPPDKGDGVEFNVYVRRPASPHTTRRVFHHYIDPKTRLEDRRWFDHAVDMSDYGGHAVDIIFETLPGPAGDDTYDWAGWSNPVLVSAP